MASTEIKQQVGGVFVRWRPMRPSELERGDENISRTTQVDSTTGLTELLVHKNTRPRINKNFDFGTGGRKRPNLSRRDGWSGQGFGGVLEETDTNVDVYEKAISPFVAQTVLQGTTGCCFAYGMTGSGKTHTLLGYGEEKGMYLLAAQDLLNGLKEAQNELNMELFIHLRFVELYNKNIYDLLNNRQKTKLLECPSGDVLLRQTVKDENGLWVSQGIEGRICSTWQEIEAAIQSGLELRTSGTSTVHEHSSRSHAIIEMEVVSRELVDARNAYAQNDAVLTKHINDGGSLFHQRKMEDNLRQIKQNEKDALAQHALIGGTLAFCDLAGAEIGSDTIRIDDDHLISTGFEGKQTEQERLEAKQINMSLMALAEVLKNQNASRKHVGYRGSPLTLYLRKFLNESNAKSLMMATVSPSHAFKKRSVQTLRYARILAENDSLLEKRRKRRKTGKNKKKKTNKKKKCVAAPVPVPAPVTEVVAEMETEVVAEKNDDDIEAELTEAKVVEPMVLEN